MLEPCDAKVSRTVLRGLGDRKVGRLLGNSSMKRSRAAQSISRCSTAHHDLFRAGPRANRTFLTARNSIPCGTFNRER